MSGSTARIIFLGLNGNQGGLTYPRKNCDVVALHAPVVRKVNDVIWRTHDQRVEILLLHELLHSAEL